MVCVCVYTNRSPSRSTVVLSCPLPLAVARIGSPPLCFSFIWFGGKRAWVNRRFAVQKFRGFFQQKLPAIFFLFDFNSVHGLEAFLKTNSIFLRRPFMLFSVLKYVLQLKLLLVIIVFSLIKKLSKYLFSFTLRSGLARFWPVSSVSSAHVALDIPDFSWISTIFP